MRSFVIRDAVGGWDGWEGGQMGGWVLKGSEGYVCVLLMV